MFKRWLNIFAGADLAIAITGMRGTGKTTLHKALRQSLPVGVYIPRQESADRESDRFVATTTRGKKRIQLVVVPGQKDSDQGSETIARYFKHGHSPDVVVHVVSWGHSTIWDYHSEQEVLRRAAEETRADAKPEPTELDVIRSYNLISELDDFRQTRQLLQEAWSKTRRPIWLLIAVSKTDLFSESEKLAEVGKYYIPGKDGSKDGEFAKELRGLVNFIGESRLVSRVAVMPISSYLESYTAGSVTISPGADLNTTSTLMANFLSTIGELLWR